MKLLVFVGIFATVLFVWSCTQTTKTPIDYSVNSPVNWEFETGSSIVFKTYNTSLEKTTDGTFIYKKYYPTTSVKTFEINYLDKERTIKQGRFTHRYDNGNIWSAGDFVADKENGEWKYYNFDGSLKKVGSFDNGLKTGTWKEYNNSLLSIEYSFNNKGDLHGKYISYNNKEKIAEIITYENGEAIKTKTYEDQEGMQIYSIVEKMPLFGKECIGIEDKELAKACGEKALLTFIYTKIQYSDFARENNITGTVYTSFTVKPDGSVSDVIIFNGLCDEIRNECIQLLKSFPDWQPGYQNDKAVKVQFNLPIRFKLE